MQITAEILQAAGDKGAKNAGESLEMLVNKKVEVTISKVEQLDLKSFVHQVEDPDGHQIAAFSQVLTGVPGAALLMLNRPDGLKLVDVLMGKEMGATTLLDEMDQSALKETLNIISNSHINALAEFMDMGMGIAVPHIITAKRIAEAIDYMAAEGAEDAALYVFETYLKVDELQIQIGLFLVFNLALAKFIQKEG